MPRSGEGRTECEGIPLHQRHPRRDGARAASPAHSLPAHSEANIRLAPVHLPTAEVIGLPGGRNAKAFRSSRGVRGAMERGLPACATTGSVDPETEGGMIHAPD